MKSKSPLALMEMLVMVLVFALAAALCLSAFALSERLSETNETRDQAVLAAQTAAEVLKSCGGDYEQAARLLDGVWSGGTLAVHTNGKFSLFVTPVDGGHSLLGSALVEVYSDRNDNLLFDLTVAWQEVDSNE